MEEGATGTNSDNSNGEVDTDFLPLARIAFNAYNEQAGGKTYDGKDIPPFDEVGEKVQANWVAATKAVVNEVTGLDKPE